MERDLRRQTEKEAPADAFVNVQFIDKVGKPLKIGQKLKLGDPYKLRIWIRRLPLPELDKGREKLSQKKVFDNKELAITLFSPDEVGMDNFRKEVKITPIKTLKSQKKVGDFVDFEVTVNGVIKKTRDGKPVRAKLANFMIDVIHGASLLSHVRVTIPVTARPELAKVKAR